MMLTNTYYAGATAILYVFFSLPLIHAHVAAWSKGMYCLNGTTPGQDNQNNNSPVVPMFQMKKEDWWMHHFDQCDQFPPAPGDFLDLPANGEFTIEFATNRAFTTLSYDGKQANTFPGPLQNGLQDDQLGVAQDGQEPQCISDPNLHAQNETMASGSAFAISYQSDIKNVTPENLVVFTVAYNTPWKRLATFKVPNLPACPDDGCICAWGWVPNGCGEPNMYMFPYKCRVTGTPGTAPLAPAQPATWCEGSLGSNQAGPNGQCVQGAKQMIFWNQLEGDNIEVEGNDFSGNPRSPSYNDKLGFADGAQIDIFLSEPSPEPPRPTMTTVRASPSATSPASTASSTESSPAQTGNANENGAIGVVASQVSTTCFWVAMAVSVGLGLLV
ncbi:hypothetical protein D9758_009090 [Tetrapyrgos nigripes]|uniref:Uncharacterized protein n=1 Tax=Tetrapyrgos nigripes TaxID=182062 RepID=A0A8H5GA39_9AGAR|nr:hypothetical protein D9758_009090 [Tetrapyrgos nigripes]